MYNTPQKAVTATPDLIVFAPKSYADLVREGRASAPNWYRLDIRLEGVDNADNIAAPAALICADFSPKQIAYICSKLPKHMPIFIQGENGFFYEVVVLETGKPTLIHPLSDESKYFRGDLVDQVGDLISILLEGVDHV
jgi:hypothetical protein